MTAATAEVFEESVEEKPTWFGSILAGAIDLIKSFRNKETWGQIASRSLGWLKVALLAEAAIWLFKKAFPFKLALRDEEE